MVMRLVRDDDPPFDEAEDKGPEPDLDDSVVHDVVDRAVGGVGDVDEHKARQKLADQEELLGRHFGQLVREQLAANAAAAMSNVSDPEHKDGAVEGDANGGGAADAQAPAVNLSA